MVRALTTILAIFGLVPICGAAESASRYVEHVKPILRARCYACLDRTPDEHMQTVNIGRLIRKMPEAPLPCKGWLGSFWKYESS